MVHFGKLNSGVWAGSGDAAIVAPVIRAERWQTPCQSRLVAIRVVNSVFPARGKIPARRGTQGINSAGHSLPDFTLQGTATWPAVVGTAHGPQHGAYLHGHRGRYPAAGCIIGLRPVKRSTVKRAAGATQQTRIVHRGGSGIKLHCADFKQARFARS